MILKKKEIRPPRFFEWLLSVLVTGYTRAIIMGDLEEEYFCLLGEKGKRKANNWYRIQVIKSLPKSLSHKFYWGGVMLKNYAKIAFRNIVKYKGYSFINITGLAFGLACSIFILLWVHDELSFDRFHENVENLYRIEQDQFYSGERYHVNVTPFVVGPAYEEKIPEVLNACRVRMIGSMMVKYGEKSILQEDIVVADPSLFEMFTFQMLTSNTNEILVDPHSIVITEKTAEKYFGDEDPIGKVLNLNKEFDFTVVGVAENPPHNSTIDFEILIPFEFLKEIGMWNESWGSNSIQTYLEVQPNSSLAAINTKMTEILHENNEGSITEYMLAPFADMHLYAYFGFGNPSSDIQYVYIFGIIAVFILLIACINFMNLSTAKSANRAKEIGLRKVTGANRFGLIQQFFGESILLALIGTLVAILIVVLLLPLFNDLTLKELPRDILLTPMILMGLALITLFTGFVAGGYPALYLSSFQPVQVLRGSLKTGAKSSGFRRVLVIFQFSLSIFLIVGTIVVYSQLDYMRTKKLGYDKEQLVYSFLPRDVKPKYEILKNKFREISSVMGVSGANERPHFISSNSGGAVWDGKDPEQSVLISNSLVDYDYLDVLGVQLVEGRGFTKDYPGDFAGDSTGNFLVNEEVVKLMNVESAIGKRFEFFGITGEIVGVMKNYHFHSVKEKIEPLALLLEPGWVDFMVVKVAPNSAVEAMRDLEAAWTAILPDYPFEFKFVEEDFDFLYRREQRMVDLLKYFAVMAIVIACLGLFGLSAFTAEQKTKEIGIRKTLGASEPKLVYLLCKEFIILVGISSVIAWSVGYYVMSGWLESFAYRFELGVSIFLFSAVLAVVISILTVSYQAIKAAVANPVKSLRYD